jgi:hypothetical protein
MEIGSKFFVFKVRHILSLKKKISNVAGTMPIILATQEGEIRRIPHSKPA